MRLHEKIEAAPMRQRQRIAEAACESALEELLFLVERRR